MEFLKNRIAQLLSMLICAGLVLLVVTFVALTGGAVMKLFGFQYESVWTIVAYFAVAELLTLPIDWISGAVPRILWYFGKLPAPAAILLYLILDAGISFAAFRAVDHWMPGVAATDTAIFVLAAITALLGVKDVLRKPNGMDQ